MKVTPYLHQILIIQMRWLLPTCPTSKVRVNNQDPPPLGVVLRANGPRLPGSGVVTYIAWLCLGARLVCPSAALLRGVGFWEFVVSNGMASANLSNSKRGQVFTCTTSHVSRVNRTALTKPIACKDRVA